jgi:hypothetical protein
MVVANSPERMNRHDRQAGQILPLFVLSMIVVLAIGALVLDGASVLVTRRHLQDAGDAAALAGANTLQATRSGRVCSTDSTNPPGAPRNDIVNAVRASVRTNWPNFPPGNLSVTCPSGWENQAVQVDLHITSNSYLGGAIGASAQNVATTSTAVNGQVNGSNYSIVVLDQSNLSWPNGRRGCPAFQISGGPTMQFDGSVIIDSTCTAANGGALAANGGAATVTMASGKTFNMVGGYSLGALTITPTPNTGASPIQDPLQTLDSASPPTTIGSQRLVLNNETQVLQPGIYPGGIQLKNSSIALLRPGIYVMDGGGLDLGAQSSFCSISATSTATDCSHFTTDCPDTTCGVLIVNRDATARTGAAMGQITVGAGATLKLRAYDDRAFSPAGTYEYRNLLIWQEATPPASPTYAQPVIQLNGGGSVDISGTVYAPQAKVQMGGGSGGSGGTNVNLYLQFICWDLEISGNATFRFQYSATDFTYPKDYGLVK